jgi:hypothetical protein
MKKLVSTGALVLVVFVGVVVSGCSEDDLCKNNDNGKIPDPGGEFDYTKVEVYLTDEATVVDKTWTPADFPGFAFSQIIDARVGGSKSLFFHLTNPSRDNILKAIYYLRSRPEIKSADIIPKGWWPAT